jgi:hypothetical protein
MKFAYLLILCVILFFLVPGNSNRKLDISAAMAGTTPFWGGYLIVGTTLQRSYLTVNSEYKSTKIFKPNISHSPMRYVFSFMFFFSFSFYIRMTISTESFRKCRLKRLSFGTAATVATRFSDSLPFFIITLCA